MLEGAAPEEAICAAAPALQEGPRPAESRAAQVVGDAASGLTRFRRAVARGDGARRHEGELLGAFGVYEYLNVTIIAAGVARNAFLNRTGEADLAEG